MSQSTMYSIPIKNSTLLGIHPFIKRVVLLTWPMLKSVLKILVDLLFNWCRKQSLYICKFLLFLEARVPQTQTAPTTTSIFGIGSIPTFGTLPSFTTLFPVSGTKCTTNSGDEGTCLSQSECDNQGGIKDGDCGTVLFRSAGVCCSCNYTPTKKTKVIFSTIFFFL